MSLTVVLSSSGCGELYININIDDWLASGDLFKHYTLRLMIQGGSIMATAASHKLFACRVGLLLNIHKHPTCWLAIIFMSLISVCLFGALYFSPSKGKSVFPLSPANQWVSPEVTAVSTPPSDMTLKMAVATIGRFFASDQLLWRQILDWNLNLLQSWHRFYSIILAVNTMSKYWRNSGF